MLYLVLYSLCISNSHWLCGCLACKRNAGLGAQATCGMPALTAKTVFDSVWNSLRHIFRSKELDKKYTQIWYSCYLFWARCHHELVGAVFNCCWSGICTLHCAMLESCGANHLLNSLTRPTLACSLASLGFLQLLCKLVACKICLLWWEKNIIIPMVETLSNFVFSGKFSRISAVEVPWESLSKKDLGVISSDIY